MTSKTLQQEKWEQLAAGPYTGPRSPVPGPRAGAASAAITAFCTCSRFSASSIAMQRGESITALASRLREAREQRNPRIIARLNDLGVSITLDEVIAGMPAPARDRRVVGRMHIAETMTAKGCVRSVDEAFAKFLGAGASAFVDKERVTPAQAIEAIRGSGGIAVLAHPVHLLCDNSAQLRRVVKELRSQGLGGIEVYHSDHDDFMTRLCLGLARELGLAVSGGSDFHGKGKPHVTIGRPRTPLSVVSGILER